MPPRIPTNDRLPKKPLAPLTIAGALALVLLAAGALRCIDWSAVALCHFEEGVHVASAQKVLQQGLWHYDYSLPYHSPPLYAWLLAVVSSVFRSPEVSGAALSCAANLLTILAVNGIGRRMVGDGFGLVAAVLFGASDLQASLSRTALPHATFTLFVTLAMWAAAELAPRSMRTTDDATGSPVQGIPRLSYNLFWGLLLGIFLALATVTQYGGLAAVGVIAISFLYVWIRGAAETEGRLPYLFTAFCLGGAMALIAFAAWYWHLQRNYPGGVAPVLRHVLGDASHFLHGPQNLTRLLFSLPALRHWGWAVTLLATAGVGGAASLAHSGWKRTLCLFAMLIAVGAATAAGGDALLLICGLAAVIPALLSRRWSPTLCAVWFVGFLGLASGMPPSVRHLSAAMPPAILLTLWLVWPTPRSNSAEESWTSLPWLAAGLLAAGWVALLSPFGATPSQSMWDRWSPGSGYAEFGQRVAVETPKDAAIICQGQPPLYVYCRREWATLFGDASFLRGLKGLPAEHPVYLALDFRYLEDPSLFDHERTTDGEARDALVSWLHCLEPIAVTPLEPSVLMLLEHLTPGATHAKLHSRLSESKWTDKEGHGKSVPPDIRTSGEDVIVLYRVDVDRIREEGGVPAD